MDDKTWQLLIDKIDGIEKNVTSLEKKVTSDISSLKSEVSRELTDIKKDTGKLRLKIVSISTMITFVGAFLGKKIGF